MKKIKILSLVLALVVLIGCISLCSCSQAENVNHNLSQSADNFECLRKITDLAPEVSG